jgi:hypothetical protein
MLYVYRTVEHMMEGIKGTDGKMMMCSEYVLQTQGDGQRCIVVKDRSGVFDTQFRHSTKKILKMIKILFDDS